MANDEDLARLRHGVGAWNDWRAQNPEHAVDLSEVDLSRASLSGASLDRANIGWVNLSGADLRGASLQGADLRGASLQRADLRGANLWGANLSGADLSEADLHGASLREAHLSGANLRRADLGAANLRAAYLYGADLRGANLQGADLGGADPLLKDPTFGPRRPLQHTFSPRLREKPPPETMQKPVDHYPERLTGFAGSAEFEEAQNVHFTVYHPKEIKPQIWCTLLAYVHILEMQSTVEADSKQRLEVAHGRRSAKATCGIVRGAEIVVVPELPGCRFNPTSARLLWLEDWHRFEFRLQAHPDLAGFELGKAVNGRVAFYVESVLVGEVPVWTCISDEADTAAADAPASTASAEPYEAIFVSYAHEDSAVVDRLGRAYKALGMEFLRDVEMLRSGEEWNSALLTMIERADIFQLYWSRAAKRSRYVKQEWSHALKQEKSHFIRPLYWQLPMPRPPRELAQLNFSYLDFDQPFA